MTDTKSAMLETTEDPNDEVRTICENCAHYDGDGVKGYCRRPYLAGKRERVYHDTTCSAFEDRFKGLGRWHKAEAIEPMPTNSAIPATVEVWSAMCPVCGTVDRTEEVVTFCGIIRCLKCGVITPAGKAETRSPQAAKQVFQALPPAAQLEMLREWAKGLGMAVVSKRDHYEAKQDQIYAKYVREALLKHKVMSPNPPFPISFDELGKELRAMLKTHKGE